MCYMRMQLVQKLHTGSYNNNKLQQPRLLTSK